jgi:hypothetical protein
MQRISELSNAHFQEKINDLEQEKENLEREIRRLVSLPFNQDPDNRSHIQTQEKCSKLELALTKLGTEHSKVKEERGKYLAELEFKSRENNVFKADNEKLKKQIKELLQKDANPNNNKEIDYSDYYRKLMGIVKLEGEDPVWRKYALLAEPSVETMTHEQLKKCVMDLWKSKLEVLAHLEKAHIELKMIAESNESRIGLYLKDKEQMEEELRAARARLDEWVSM